jgi:glyoxylase-like metal-dependent hydrolase (beta-lactamase superfamily II)/ferredoxin
MATVELRHPGNARGEFFVDTSCIDCDLCRQIAPEVFWDVGDQSVVQRQPTTAAEEHAALKALVTCPTASIGALGKHAVGEAVAAYPEPIDRDVWFCGFASRNSFGGASYLIRRISGNVLVDSPRFNRPLARRIEEMGGVRWMFLTHQDDVADHEAWAARFGAERVLHGDDARGIRGIERLLAGSEPVRLADDLLVVPTPGHTRGHAVLLHEDRFLFSGDHVWASGDGKSLAASRGVCWFSWSEQIRSMEKLRDHHFEWVLPGHGRRFHAEPQRMRRALEECISAMKRRA